MPFFEQCGKGIFDSDGNRRGVNKEHDPEGNLNELASRDWTILYQQHKAGRLSDSEYAAARERLLKSLEIINDGD